MTLSVWPVINLASPEARKSTGRATSVGLAGKPRGIREIAASRVFSGIPRPSLEFRSLGFVNLVSTKP